MTTATSVSEPADIRRDVAAGLCVAGLLLPEAVAYAGLAHVATSQALTAVLLGLCIYGLWGGSPVAIVAPTSSTATLMAAAAWSLAGGSAPATAEFNAFALALLLCAGLLLVLLGLAGQGQLSAYVSRPVLRGFAMAVALSIVIRQLPDLLGLSKPAGSSGDPLTGLVWVLGHLQDVHPASALLGLAAGALVALLRRWPRWPASLLVMALSIVLSQWLGWGLAGIEEIGPVEPPRFQVGLPDLPVKDWLRVGELAFGLVVLIFAESWGSLRSQARAHDARLDPNTELKVLGACNIASALLHGMPVGAGFSATSANAGAGATSRRAGWVAWAVIVLALLTVLPALQHLPRPVLAVAVISALAHALNPRPLIEIWRMNRDRLLLLASVLAVLLFGVMHGMLIAIAMSVLDALRRFSLPIVHELGELGDSRNFVVRDAHPEARVTPGVAIFRPEEPLFFANAERVMADVLAATAGRPGLRNVVLSLEESADLDSTALACLLELDQQTQASGQQLLLTRVKEPVRELLGRWQPEGLGAPQRLFWSVADAVQAAQPAPELSP